MNGQSKEPLDRLNIAILGYEKSPYVQDLLRASREADILAKCCSFAELSATIQSNQPTTSVSDYDAVLVRSMPVGSLEQVIFRMDCLQVLQDSGKLVVNSPKCMEVAIDKWLTLHRLQKVGIPVPNTVACQTREEALSALKSLGGDIVIKSLFGGEGRGMLRLQDADLAWRVFSTLQHTQSVIYAQQFYPHFGYDIRVLLVGDQHFAIKRIARQDDWRTNVARGSRAEPIRLDDANLDLARRAARAVDGDTGSLSVLGVDLLPCRDGETLVLEVNAVPGWKGLGGALQVDVASEIIRQVKRAL